MQTPLSSSAPARLYAILLKMRPLEGGTGHSLMPFSGDLVHAAFLNWVRSSAPDVAEWLHAGNKRRLFTCSSLQFPFPFAKMRGFEKENVHLPLYSEKLYTVRVTLLMGELFPLLYEALLGFNTQETHTKQRPFMQLGKQTFLLQEAVMSDDHSGWTGFSSLNTLVQEVQVQKLNTIQPLNLEFASLTTFNWSNQQNRIYGNYYATLPLPHYIFPMLANRWVDLVPPELGQLVQRDRIAQYIQDEGIIIHDHDIRTHHVMFTNHPQRGFVGTCTYHLRGPDEATTPDAPLTVRQQLLLLARFAFYAGVGYKTAMGMGQVRVL